MIEVFPSQDIVTNGTDWKWFLWHKSTDTDPDRYKYWWHLLKPLPDEPFDDNQADALYYETPFDVYRGIYQPVSSVYVGGNLVYGFSSTPFVVGMPQVIPAGMAVRAMIHQPNNSSDLLNGSAVTWRFQFSPNSNMTPPVSTHDVTLPFPPNADMTYLETFYPTVNWRYVAVGIIDPVIVGSIPNVIGVELPHVGIHALWAEVDGQRIVPRRTLLGASV